MGVRYSKWLSHDFVDHLNTRHFGPLTGFFSPVFSPPFEYLTSKLADQSGIQMVTYCISKLPNNAEFGIVIPFRPFRPFSTGVILGVTGGFLVPTEQCIFANK